MNVSLTPELEKFVQDKVKSGDYHSASEVIRDGLRGLKIRDHANNNEVDPGYKAWFNEQLQLGADQLARGEIITAEELDVHLDELFEKLEDKHG